MHLVIQLVQLVLAQEASQPTAQAAILRVILIQEAEYAQFALDFVRAAQVFYKINALHVNKELF